MTDILDRLRNPPFGTETSERNLMNAAADEIERLRAAFRANMLRLSPDTSHEEINRILDECKNPQS